MTPAATCSTPAWPGSRTWWAQALHRSCSPSTLTFCTGRLVGRYPNTRVRWVHRCPSVPGACHLPFGLARTSSTCIVVYGWVGSPAAIKVASVRRGAAGGQNAGAIRADPIVVTPIGSR